MIILTDVAAKLQEILNDKTNPLNANDFSFVVKSQGYHLDSIADENKEINVIPVFVSMIGGEYNPVPNLKEANFTYQINIFYPVRFKDTFYALNEYLEDVFVGKKLTIGSNTPLCNISPSEYGEIVGVELSRFKEWIREEYNNETAYRFFEKEQEVCEEYMSMQFKLYTTTLGSGFMFGNDVKLTLTYKKDATHSYTLTDPTFDNASIQSNTEEDGEQVLDAQIKEISGAPQVTSYGNGFQLYYNKNSEFCNQILTAWCSGNSQEIEVTCKYTFREADTTVTPNIPEISFSRTCYVKSVNIPIIKGEPISLTFGFAKKVSVS